MCRLSLSASTENLSLKPQGVGLAMTSLTQLALLRQVRLPAHASSGRKTNSQFGPNLQATVRDLRGSPPFGASWECRLKKRVILFLLGCRRLWQLWSADTKLQMDRRMRARQHERRTKKSKPREWKARCTLESNRTSLQSQNKHTDPTSRLRCRPRRFHRNSCLWHSHWARRFWRCFWSSSSKP